MLDTNACVHVVRGYSSAVVAAIRERDPRDLCISAVTKAELLFGAYRSERAAENLRVLGTFFSAIDSIPFDDAAAEHYAEIRLALATRGEMIGPNDLLIGATARAHGCTLITHNVREFSRIPKLRIEDWEAE